MNICILAQLHLNLVRTYKEMKNDQGAIDSIEKLLFILSHLPLSFEDCKKFNRQLRDFFISTNHSEKEKDLSRYQSEFDRRRKDYEESLRNFSWKNYMNLIRFLQVESMRLMKRLNILKKILKENSNHILTFGIGIGMDYTTSLPFFVSLSRS